jgi:hypothetical protein
MPTYETQKECRDDHVFNAPSAIGDANLSERHAPPSTAARHDARTVSFLGASAGRVATGVIMIGNEGITISLG